LWFVANKNDRNIGDRLDSKNRSGHIWARAVIPAQRIERDPHQLIPSFPRFCVFFHRDCFPSLIEATVRADTVGQNGFVAAGTILNLHGGDPVVTPPGTLFCV
jgi:hypothetical protein